MERIIGLDFPENKQALIAVATGYVQTAEVQVILHTEALRDRLPCVLLGML